MPQNEIVLYNGPFNYGVSSRDDDLDKALLGDWPLGTFTMNTYNPHPIDLSSITLPAELGALVEALAENDRDPALATIKFILANGWRISKR